MISKNQTNAVVNHELSKKDKKKDSKLKNALSWSWEFTKFLVVILTIIYVAQMLFSALVIYHALDSTNMLTYLDSFITETNETFRLIVGANVVKSCVENVFKYNDFGGKSIYNNNSDNDTNNQTPNQFN